MPSPTEEFFFRTSHEFESLYDFPNCIGYIDCKYIRTKNQNDLPTYLQVIIGANFRFMGAEVITNDHDKIFSSSDLFNCLETKKYNFPSPLKITVMNADLPFVFLGGRGYPLKQYLLRPYKIRNSHKQVKEQFFNQKLMKLRHPVECGFSLLTTKWGCLTTEVQSDYVDKIVKTSCLLHNVTIDKEGLDDTTFLNLKEIRHRIGLIRTSGRVNSPDRAAISVRNVFKHYVCSKYQNDIPCTS